MVLFLFTDCQLFVTDFLSGLEEKLYCYKGLLVGPMRRDCEENILFYEIYIYIFFFVCFT